MPRQGDKNMSIIYMNEYLSKEKLFNKKKKVVNADYINAEEPSQTPTSKQKIYLNDLELDRIPRIDLNIENLIIANGFCIDGDYIDDLGGHLAIYRYSEPDLPMVWIRNGSMPVYVQLTEDDIFGIVCSISFQYDREGSVEGGNSDE